MRSREERWEERWEERREVGGEERGDAWRSRGGRTCAVAADGELPRGIWVGVAARADGGEEDDADFADGGSTVAARKPDAS